VTQRRCQVACRGRVLIGEVRILESLPDRMKGLLGLDGLPSGVAVWLDPCSSIHTVGMQFDLDLIFLTADRHVCKIVTGVTPWRMVLGGTGAHSVIEMQSGWLPSGSLAEGDEIGVTEL
jgi:uncharacterized protein